MGRLDPSRPLNKEEFDRRVAELTPHFEAGYVPKLSFWPWRLDNLDDVVIYKIWKEEKLYGKRGRAHV